MKCTKCETDMVIGKAIDYDERTFGIFANSLLNKDTLKMIEVHKCPKCGHSKKIEESF